MALVSIVPSIHFAYRDPAMHVATETAAALISIIAAQLAYGRFRHSYQLRDLLLTASLGVFAAANLLFSAIPAVADASPGRLATWTPVGGRLLGAALLAIAALAPERTLRHPARDARRALVGCAIALAGLTLAAAVAGGVLPDATEPALRGAASEAPLVSGSPFVLGAQGAAVVLFAAAAVGYSRVAQRTPDEFTRWLAIAATLGAFARLNLFLYPSLYPAYFYAGDVLRLAFFVALLIGGFLELRRTRHVLAAAAVSEERQRIARDIHDGVAQDLAFILQHGRRIAAQAGAPASIGALVSAAERALDESRHAIAALARSGDEPLAEALTLTALETAGREGRIVEVRVDSSADVPPGTQEALLRVVREAIINAIRHGGAQHIKVELSEHPQLRLVVTDDGSGFDVEAAARAPGRLGLRGMDARVRTAGGQLTVESAPGRGTRVEVLLP
jgi:signal transduction histidine kinase